MSPLVSSLIAGVVMGAISFVGFLSLSMAKKRLATVLEVVVAFAAGAMLGAAFFHLLPEAVELGGPVFEVALLGLVVFFVLDSLLWVYHCHGGHQLHGDHKHGSCPEKPIGYLNLAGDALHNLLDGVVVAGAFIAGGPALGIPTTIAVALHEIPQEIGDYGILIWSGFSQKKALLWNVVVAVMMLVGIVLVFIAEPFVENLELYALPFAAGGFLYMAGTNLLSEIKEEPEMRVRVWQFALFLAGLALMWFTAGLE